MNLGAMRTALQTRGYSTDTAAEQTELLASAYRELWSQKPWTWLENSQALSTAAGTVIYTPTTPVSGVSRIYISANTFVKPLSNDEFFQRLGEIDTQAAVGIAPVYWTWYAKSLWLWPKPGAVFAMTVFGWKIPADLAADGDTPSDLPSQYHDIIIFGALADLALRERDAATADRWAQIYQRRLGALNDMEDTILRARSRVLPPSQVVPDVWTPMAAQPQAPPPKGG